MLIWLQTLPMFKCSVSSGSSKVNYCFQIQYTGYWKIKSTLSSEIYFLHIKLSPILPFPSSKNGKIIIEVWNPSSTHSIDTKCFLLLHMHMMQRGNLKVLTDKFNLQSCLCHSKPVIYSPYVAETLWSECLCIGIWTKTFIGKLRQQLRGKEFDHYHRSLGLVRAPMSINVWLWNWGVFCSFSGLFCIWEILYVLLPWMFILLLHTDNLQYQLLYSWLTPVYAFK